MTPTYLSKALHALAHNASGIIIYITIIDTIIHHILHIHTNNAYYSMTMTYDTYHTKALHALARNASGIIIVNNEDRLESPASGLGI
jgi:hypothetical protein